MDIKINSIVFYKNDFENLLEMDRLDRAQIIERLLSELFLDEKVKLTQDQWPIYKMLRDKILRSVKNYQSKKCHDLERIGGEIYEG